MFSALKVSKTISILGAGVR